jgi:thiamine biosynthesis lipoprotein
MGIFKLKETHDPHPWKWWHIPLLVLLIAGTVYVVITNGHGTKGTWYQQEGSVFGTIYHITYNHPTELRAGIESTFRDIDNSLSTFNDSSVISAINTNRSDTMDSRLSEIVKKATEINRTTDGAFDITVAPLVNAWGFGFKNSENVDSMMIDSILQFTGMDKISVSGHTLQKKDHRVMLDCNAIAKGYGVDAVSNYLSSEGITDFMVEIGGEVRVKGKNKEGHNWRIGINEPIDDSLSVNNELQNVLEVTEDGMSMATSGNYRNFYIKNNKKYAHTIDPKTGYPVQHNILSSTVLAEDCMTADAYATAFMVAGLEKSKAILQKVKGIKAYFIYAKDDGTNGVWHSPGLKLDDD